MMRLFVVVTVMAVLACGCDRSATPHEKQREVRHGKQGQQQELSREKRLATNSVKANTKAEIRPVRRTRAAVRAEGLPSREVPWPGSPEIYHSEGYTGSLSCKECHDEEFRSWEESYHSTMTQIASRATVIPRIEGVNLNYEGLHGSLEWRDDELWATVTGPNGTTVENRVALTTGSHHVQAFWYATGDSRVIQMFPFSFRIAEQRWIPVATAFLLPPHLETHMSFSAGNWNHSCSQCHATNIKPLVTNAQKMQTQVSDFGISCESCHGPGEQHIAVAQEEGSDNEHIVNPVNLGAKRSTEVCGQCHAVLSLDDEDAKEDWLKHGWRYRPGEKLSESKTILQPTGDFQDSIDTTTFWGDGVVRIAGREYNGLLKSPCYNHDGSAGEIVSCASCHESHRGSDDPEELASWAHHTLKSGMRSNLACTQCHDEYKDEQKLIAHTHHAVDSGGSECMNCHMPYTSYGLLKAARSHTIESPSVATTLEYGRPNGCNQCHLETTLGWTADHLSKWYGIESPELPEEDRTISYAILSALKGNALQRALAAWTIGWSEAHKASTMDWVVPFLGFLLQDNYHAVRFIAARSLRTIPGYENALYDSLAPKAERDQAAKVIYRQWASQPESNQTTGPELLISHPGRVMAKQLDDFLKQRDTSIIFIAE